MLTSKWHMHRMGLVDFWYYVNEEFYFKNGHLLLRGSNGSGKSVTMQSFIPLLLDGNKSSERLDPFGTKSRKIESYLLDEEGKRDERIAYLYLEFKREDSDVFKTIGIGLHAKKGRDVDSWYFVLEDNRRVNIDFSLMENKLAITKARLKNIIGEDAFITAQKVYMDRVNRSLFGFETIDEYKEAITLLLQLRSPKLSNSLKPTRINEILSDSLQALSEEDLRPMSEAITNMDGIEDRLKNLKVGFQAAKNIHQVYDAYNQFTLVDKYRKYDRENKKSNTLEVQLADTDKAIHAVSKQLEEQLSIQKATKQEKNILEEEKRSLSNQDLERLHEEMIQRQNELANLQAKLTVKEQHEENKNSQLITKRGETKRKKDAMELSAMEYQSAYHELEDIQERLQFGLHLTLQTALKQEEQFDFLYCIRELQKEIQQLKEGLVLFAEYEKKANIYQSILEQKETMETEADTARATYRSIYEQYNGIIEEYKEKFTIWNQKNTLIQLTNDQMHSIMNLLVAYEEEQQFHQIIHMVRDKTNQLFKQLQVEKVELEHQINQLSQEKSTLQAELHEWEANTDPTPESPIWSKNNRKQLEQRGIAYRPFYQLLEFAPSVSEQHRNVIEEACIRMGMLDALVVSNAVREEIQQFMVGCGDNYLFTTLDPTTIKSVYLTGSSVDELCHEINVMLFQWGVSKERALSIDDHTFQIGVLQGTLSKDMQAQYIGKETRALLRKAQMERLEQEIDQLEVTIEKKQQLSLQIKEKLEVLQQEQAAMPKEDDLREAWKEVKDSRASIALAEQAIQRLMLMMEQQSKEMQVVSREIQQQARILQIGAKKDIFEARKDSFEAYMEYLHQLHTSYREYLSCKEAYGSYSQQIEDAEHDLDDIRYEISTLLADIDKHKKVLALQQNQLQEAGFDKYQERFAYVMKRLDEIPKKLEELATSVGTLENQLKHDQDNKQQLSLQVEQQSIQTQLYESIVMEEAALEYVLSKPIGLQDLKRFVNSYQQSRNTEKIHDDVQTIFYNNRSSLQEYGLMMSNILIYPDVDDIASRLEINARYKGEKISFQALLGVLEEAILRQENLLIDSDRNLFEDVLMNTISKKIRIRIQNSRQWVDRMNRFMSDMHTSSGLMLNLKWQGKKAENEDELATEQLVALLEKDTDLLKLDDMSRLTTHFRLKVQAARVRNSEVGTSQSFHQAMRDILDYRTWFEFKIMAHKTGEKSKELTNMTFFAFSGGEKAMSMYIPLFSAVAAKFESAKEDAPLLIALDEAFAGVDEKNIENMFELIRKFNFDYIMNSQVLWGDYVSVPCLAIYELFRPENASYVTIIAYEWDGHKKRMVSA